MRITCCALLVAMFAAPVWAQESAPVVEPEALESFVRAAIHEDVLVTASIDLEAPPAKVADKKFWLVSGALNSAMLLDTWTTFNVLNQCAGCREGNPYVEPFVKRGPIVTTVAGQLFDIGVLTMAAKMKGSSNPKLRRVWWLVPVALTTGHIWAAHHNWQIAQRQRQRP